MVRTNPSVSTASKPGPGDMTYWLLGLVLWLLSHFLLKHCWGFSTTQTSCLTKQNLIKLAYMCSVFTHITQQVNRLNL